MPAHRHWRSPGRMTGRPQDNTRRQNVSSYCEWYSCDNLIRDPMPFLEQDGHPAGGASWLAVLNPDADREAEITITIFSTQLATDPQQHHCSVPAGQTRLIELHTLPGAPRNEFFGV